MVTLFVGDVSDLMYIKMGACLFRQHGGWQIFGPIGLMGWGKAAILANANPNLNCRGRAMNAWMINGVFVLFAILASTGLFFFVVTRGALVLRGLSPGSASEKSHVYPIYSNMGLIKLVDFQPIISAILLFQYHHLVSKIVSELKQMDLRNRKVLITSCAFGNVIPRVVEASLQSGADRILIADIIKNELVHAKSKLAQRTSSVGVVFMV